jgi:acid phosphatase
MRSRYLLLPLLLFAAAIVHSQPVAAPTPHEKLHAVLWTQTAPEFRGATLQAYRMARQSLEQALHDRDWTAAVEQTGRYQNLPPAVIVDIDETILDNSASQARMIQNGQDFIHVWDQWVSEADAAEIPGALDFLQYAHARGATVFYITNRDHHKHYEATRRNLRKFGFPISPSEETLLMLGAKPEWTSDKSSRRKLVASSHRIVMLIGDDIGDFLPGIRTSIEKRMEMSRPYDAFWGLKWFMIPNATYGSWEEAPYDFDRSAPESRKLDTKRKALRSK